MSICDFIRLFKYMSFLAPQRKSVTPLKLKHPRSRARVNNHTRCSLDIHHWLTHKTFRRTRALHDSHTITDVRPSALRRAALPVTLRFTPTPASVNRSPAGPRPPHRPPRPHPPPPRGPPAPIPRGTARQRGGAAAAPRRIPSPRSCPSRGGRPGCSGGASSALQLTSARPLVVATAALRAAHADGARRWDI